MNHLRMFGVLASAGMIFYGAKAQGQYAPVYGGPPIYQTGTGGYLGPEFNFGPTVNDSGTATAFERKYDGTTNVGYRPIRWDKTGFVELGNLGVDANGYTDARPSAINAAGTVVGSAGKYDSNHTLLGSRAVRWDASGTAAVEMANLGTDAGGTTYSGAQAINALGIAVGSAEKYDSSGNDIGSRPVRWDASGTTVTELGHLGSASSGYTTGEAESINNVGTAIGYVKKYDASHNYLGMEAVRWDASSTTAVDLGNLGTDSFGRATSSAGAINAAGTIIGYSNKYDAAHNPLGQRALRWDASSTSPTELSLGNFGYSATGGTHSAASAINNADTIVGIVGKYDSAGNSLGDRAVRWDAANTLEELGNLGVDANGSTTAYALDINAAGEIVGFADKYDQTHNYIGQRAVYWGLDGAAVDLNDLIDPNSGWTLTRAWDISDTGWIDGIGSYDPDGPGGQMARDRLFLIHVPEPGGLCLLAIGGLGMLRRRKE